MENLEKAYLGGGCFWCLDAVYRRMPGVVGVVAGYSNEVMCYIPSERVLKEGGYEAESSMIYYGMPGPFETGIEEQIMTTIHTTLKNIQP